MIRHIVAWNFKTELTEEERKNYSAEIKEKLEALKDVIPGVLSLSATNELVAGSTRQFMLDSAFGTEEELANYQVHPEHKKVGELIGKVMMDRVCLDFVE